MNAESPHPGPPPEYQGREKANAPTFLQRSTFSVQRFFFIPPLLLAILVLTTFWSVVHFQFIDWDDWLALAENPDFSPVAWHKIAGYWLHAKLELYAPLSYTFWAAIAWTQQTVTHRIPLSPGLFHLANLTLHLIASLMVFLLLRRLVTRSLPAFAGAIIFALHPLQIEPVAWVASFNTLLSVMLSIVALWAYVHYAQSEKHTKQIRWFIVSCIALLLALFAKPMAIPAPAIALLIDALILRRPFRRWIGPILIWIIIVIPFVIIGRLVQLPYQATQTSIWLRPLIVADSFAFYLCKIFCPLHLTIDYQRTPIRLLQSRQIWFTWILPATVFLIAGISYARSRKNRSANPPWLLAGLAIMFIATFPTSGIVGFAFQRYSTVADRYMYLGILGIALAFAGLAKSLPPRFLLIILIVITPLFMLRDHLRLSDWHDTLAITANAVQVNDDCALDHRVRAFALSRLGRIDESIAQYKLAIHYDPLDANTYYDYANLLCRQGRADASLAMYENAIALLPQRAEYHHNYAVALMATGKKSLAGPQFRKATELDPTSDQARNDYAKWQHMQKP